MSDTLSAEAQQEASRQEHGPVEQYAALAALITHYPHLAETLAEVADKLVMAEVRKLTGKVQVNFQHGMPRSVQVKGSLQGQPIE